MLRQLASNIPFESDTLTLGQAHCLGTVSVTQLSVDTNVCSAAARKSYREYYWWPFEQAPWGLSADSSLLFQWFCLSRIFFRFLQLRVSGGLLYTKHGLNFNWNSQYSRAGFILINVKLWQKIAKLVPLILIKWLSLQVHHDTIKSLLPFRLVTSTAHSAHIKGARKK